MRIDIQRDILGLKGQRVNQITLDEQAQQLVIHCHRDKRRNAIDAATGKVLRHSLKPVTECLI